MYGPSIASDWFSRDVKINDLNKILNRSFILVLEIVGGVGLLVQIEGGGWQRDFRGSSEQITQAAAKVWI